MDELFDKMVSAMRNNNPGCNDDVDASDIRAALRAVSDTHRLVPIEPTNKMVGAGNDGVEPMFSTELTWEEMVDAAPDYTGGE